MYELWEVRWDDLGVGLGEAIRLSGLDVDQARLVRDTMTAEEEALIAYVSQGGEMRLHSHYTFEIRRDGVPVDLPTNGDAA